jgi:hypothetical protein
MDTHDEVIDESYIDGRQCLLDAFGDHFVRRTGFADLTRMIVRVMCPRSFCPRC